MSELYHIYIMPRNGVMRPQVEEKLNLAVNWFRYNERCYVVETTSNEDKWQERLLPLVNPGGYLFICKFDSTHYHGFMSPKFWEWFHERRNKQ